MEQPTKELPTKQKAAKKKAAKNVPKVMSESMMSSVGVSPKSTIGKTEMECSQSPFDTGKSKIGTVKTNSQAPGSTECTTEGRTQTFKRIYKDAEKSGAQERVEGVNSESSMVCPVCLMLIHGHFPARVHLQLNLFKIGYVSAFPRKVDSDKRHPVQAYHYWVEEAQPSSKLTMPSKTGSYDSSAMHD
uniref:Ovule protein n=1 Tax=Steinernema glaseri TaxID=37863 RepID=A0A1I8A9N3_9BILA